jgi:hypothetical protein
VVKSTPQPHFTPGKDPVPIVQEAGWAPGTVWTGGKSRPTGIRSPDRPARSQSLYRLSYLAQTVIVYMLNTPCTTVRFQAGVTKFLFFFKHPERGYNSVSQYFWYGRPLQNLTNLRISLPKLSQIAAVLIHNSLQHFKVRITIKLK